MGVDTKGIIFGSRSIDEIAGALSGSYDRATVDSGRISKDVLGVLNVVDKTDPRRLRALFCMALDRHEVHEGPVTVVSLGCFGDSIAIVQSLVECYGGYVLDHDDAEWRVVEAKRDVETTPQVRLLTEVTREFGFANAAIVRGMIDDPAKLETLATSVRTYLDEVAPSPTPR